MSSLDFLFKPRSIAVIGAAHSSDKLGGIVLKNLLGFRGRVYPINPKYTELMGLKSYPSLADIPEPADISLIIRPSSEVPELLKLHRGRARCAIVVTSGFAEVGHEQLQDEIRKIGSDIGVRILGPNCMGLYNPYHRVDTLLLPADTVPRPARGNIAVVSQSGAVVHCLFGILRKERLGVSSVVTYGNALDIDEHDLYDHFLRDRRTDVVVSYIESVRDGRRFIEKARELTEKKALIVLKAGKGSGGQAAAYSHTGRLAGKYEVFHSILRQFGIQEVPDFDGLADSVKALASQRPSQGRRVMIITNGGGSGVLAVDECLRHGLETPALSAEKEARLKKQFPDFYVVRNPLDLTAQVRDSDYHTALEELQDEYDGFIVMAYTGVSGLTPGIAGLLKEMKQKIQKPLVMHMSCGCGSAKLIREIEKTGIPVYPSPEGAVRGIRALLM